MGRLSNTTGLFYAKVHREGLPAAVSKSRELLNGRLAVRRFSKHNPDAVRFADVLFINGCAYSVPHPVRYRVDHQSQQLEASGITVGRVDAWNLTLEMAGDARVFIIFRCPYTDKIGEFIKRAKQLNKVVLYDIDDLVFDTKYTDTIPFVAAMAEADRASYDDGVRLMGKTMSLCDGAITTTERLAQELSRYLPKVFVNRNVASEEMLFFSEQAIYERDVLPTLDENHVPDEEKRYQQWSREQAASHLAGDVVIGYLSGSITHNADFEYVLPALVRVLEERPQVKLRLAGELDLPEALRKYEGRILKTPFDRWEQLPRVLAGTDINIAPLTDSVFNEAKSENKWVEAALVKVPTVASNIGAFAKMIEDGKTGFLCSTVDEWHDVLIGLVDDPARRASVGALAYDWAQENAVTIKTGHRLASFIGEVQRPNVFFAFPSLDTSGGLLVALKHACILQDAGYDVAIISDDEETYKPWVEYDGHSFPVRRVHSDKNRDIRWLMRGHADLMVATFWATTRWIREYPNRDRIGYLVQNFEPEFYSPGDGLRVSAASTYGCQDVEYLTISIWCHEWLEKRWGQKVRFVPNGIDAAAFAPVERDWSGKIRILIEGDSSAPHKNVDEAFDIVRMLDRDKYEIWYMSYKGEPKSTYRVDKFFHKVPHDEVADIYRACNILLKTSILESFSYPPLEMMATGGCVVVAPNEGNIEYIKNESNCLTYDQGDIEAAARCIERIASDEALRANLYENGLKTASSRDWKNLRQQVLALYQAKSQ